MDARAIDHPYVVNLRGWPGTSEYRAPSSPPVYSERLHERPATFLFAAAKKSAVPECFGLGGYLNVTGRSISVGGLIVPDGLSRKALHKIKRAADARLIETTMGTQSWRVDDLAAYFDPFATTETAPYGWAANYRRAGRIVGADLGRTLGLMAEFRVPREGKNADNWSVWLPGYGRQCDPESARVTRTSPNSPELGVKARRVGWQVEFAPTKETYGKRRNGRTWRGEFIDLLSLGYALDADRGASFSEHRQNFGLSPLDLPIAIPRDEDGALQVIETLHALHELAFVLDEDAAQWFTTSQDRAEGRGRINLSRTSSPGALAKDLPARFGIKGPLDKFNLTEDEHRAWAKAYHGGLDHCDPRLVGLPFDCNVLDVTSAFPLTAQHVRWWDLFTAAKIEHQPRTRDLRQACKAVANDPAVALDPALWACFGVTLPTGHPDGPFPVNIEDEYRADGRMEVTTVRSSDRPMHYAWADWMAAAVRLGDMPGEITLATRLAPVGRQEGLRAHLPVVPGFVAHLDEDPVLGFVRRRQKAKAEGDRALSGELHAVVNSFVSGGFARMDPTRRREGRRWVPWEKPGPYNFMPIAVSVEAGARLLLTVLVRLVRDRGGVVAYMDTDSAIIPASPEGGVLTLRDGSTVRQLPNAEVDEIAALFAPLSPARWWPVWKVAR